MSFPELLILAVGLAMDAFAVAVCKGLSLRTLKLQQALLVGVWFGLFQALMPLIGWLSGSLFESFITSIDHWIAFLLLGIIGINMIRDACKEDAEEQDNDLTLRHILLLAVATSIDAFAIGITGFMQAVIVYGGLGLVAVIIALVLFILLIQPDTTFLQKVGRTAGILLCLAAAFFLVRPLVLDIPYLKRPEAANLERLEFEYSRGIGDYGSDDYYLRGVDMTGERHSFEISEKRYEEGRALWGENDFALFAKVTYLPHTSTLITLEFMTELDAPEAELYPTSPELPNDWESFSIQINDAVYTLPLPLADFLDDGWVISAEDAGLSLPGAEGPYASYEWEWVSLTNDHEQDISVCVFNTTESAIPAAEGTVGGIHAIYGNYDFSGTDLRLPGGLMLGWSTREDVLKLYGQPDDSYEAYSLTYETPDPVGGACWELYFDDAGFLHDVTVRHQAHSRPD